MVREKRGRRAERRSIWETPRIKKMLAEPFGTPVELTKDEAIAIARDAFGKGKGRWPDGAEYVKRIRPIWRGLLKKSDG